MDIINKIMVGAFILLVAVFIVPSAQAGEGVSVWDIDICEHIDGLYGEVGLKNQDTENSTVLLFVQVDGVFVYSDCIQTNVRLFKGFTVSRPVYTKFKISDEEGTHQMEVEVTSGRNVQHEIYEYTVYNPAEEETEEEVEDWLECL